MGIFTQLRKDAVRLAKKGQIRDVYIIQSNTWMYECKRAEPGVKRPEYGRNPVLCILYK